MAQDRVGFATSVSYTEPVQPAPTEHRQTTAARDSSAVSSTSAPPSGPAITPDRRTIPASLIYGTILLVLVLLVVAVWGFGGFKGRTDILKTMPPGSLLITGPYEFRFTEATAQHKKDWDGTFYWQVVVIGQGRTTGKESIGPSYTKDASIFVSKDDVTQHISFPESLTLGGERYNRRQFTPGLPLISCVLEFKYDDKYRPGPTIRLVVWDLIYGKHLLTSDEESWHKGTYGYQLYLPIRVLPPDEG